MRYVYIGCWWPTKQNEDEMIVAPMEDRKQKAFDDPVEASAYFMEKNLYPFVIERIEVLS